MNDSPPPPERKRGRLWISVGEAAAVLAVIIAALSFWDSHRQHLAEDRRVAGEAAQAARESEARSALVLRAAADDGGRRLTLEAVAPAQVIQSQRYLFPGKVLDHPMEVDAARPQIDVVWVASGLDRALSAARVRGDGEARVPVGISTTYVEGGDTHQDRSLYLIGYKWRSHFLGGREITLQGLALQRRAISGDLDEAVARAWKAPASR